MSIDGMDLLPYFELENVYRWKSLLMWDLERIS